MFKSEVLTLVVLWHGSSLSLLAILLHFCFVTCHDGPQSSCETLPCLGRSEWNLGNCVDSNLRRLTDQFLHIEGMIVWHLLTQVLPLCFDRIEDQVRYFPLLCGVSDYCECVAILTKSLGMCDDYLRVVFLIDKIDDRLWWIRVLIVWFRTARPSFNSLQA